MDRRKKKGEIKEIGLRLKEIEQALERYKTVMRVLEEEKNDLKCKRRGLLGKDSVSKRFRQLKRRSVADYLFSGFRRFRHPRVDDQ